MGRHTLIDVLSEIYRTPKSLQSNYARTHAYSFGRLASLGLITTAIKQTFGNFWRVTHKGLRVLEIGEGK